MKITIVLAVLCLGLMAQTGSTGKVTTTHSDTPRESSSFAWQYTCGGLTAEKWSDNNGWHVADCMEMAQSLSNLRDYRNVLVGTTPDVADMLTYEQYRYHFEIDPKDFEKAQANCLVLLQEGYAHPDILSQCRKTIAGIVPYGLKLRGGR